MLEYWFPTPIWSFKLSGDIDYEEALKFCHNLSNETEGVQYSNEGGWQSSHYDISFINKTPLKIIFEKITKNFDFVLKDLNTNYKLNFGNIWININNFQHFNRKHWHPNSEFSGVFYLTNNNSEIIFFREKDPMLLLLKSLQSDAQNDLTFDCCSYTPTQGHLLIFPGFLEHMVKKNNSTQPRVSVAFNIIKV